MTKRSADSRQRKEAGIQVIEALIDQAQRHDLDADRFGQIAMCFEIAANSVSRPNERRAIGTRPPEGIALPFECAMRR